MEVSDMAGSNPTPGMFPAAHPDVHLQEARIRRTGLESRHSQKSINFLHILPKAELQK